MDKIIIGTSGATDVILHRCRGCILQYGSLGHLLQMRPRPKSLPCLSNSCLLLKHISSAYRPRNERTVPSINVLTRASVLLSHVVIFSGQDMILPAY